MRRICLPVAMVLAALCLGYGFWIPVKAEVAQWLLQRAWQQSLARGVAQKPWPWADTEIIGRLLLDRESFVLLRDGGGESLAFAPSHVEGSALPGAPGTSIIAGHRDTHFQFLPTLAIGQRLTVQSTTGDESHYRIQEKGVVDRPSLTLTDDGGRYLVLATCWPIGGQNPSPEQRYLVIAAAEETSARRK